jgi:hypothetical protein
MSEGNSNRDDGLRLDRKAVSRRGFLHGAGMLSLAALAPTKALSAVESEAAAGQTGRHPFLGALFNPYHRPGDWTVLARRRPEGMPLTGAYSSAMEGTVVTQIHWARQMGLGFFLASYCPGRNHDGVDALFAAAERTDFSVGLSVDLRQGAGSPQQRPWQSRLTAALGEISSRYLSSPAYLRTGAGRPVLGVAGVDDGKLLQAELATVGRRDKWGPVLRFPSSWQRQPDPRLDPALAQAVEHDGLYAGFSARPPKRSAFRRIPAHSIAAGLAFPLRRPDGGIDLPAGSAMREVTYVIFDSFNNWGVSVPLEPGSLSRTEYVNAVAAWSRRQVA